MKIPSLDLELKVLLTVVGICVFGILRMTHVIRLSETDDISLLFVLGAILSGLLVRSGRYSPASHAVFCLCFGLMILSFRKPNASTFDTYFSGLFAAFFGILALCDLFLALQDSRKAKRKGTPELQVKE